MTHTPHELPFMNRLGWFLAYWVLGILALAAVALALRLVMNAAGLSA